MKRFINYAVGLKALAALGLLCGVIPATAQAPVNKPLRTARGLGENSKPFPQPTTTVPPPNRAPDAKVGNDRIRRGGQDVADVYRLRVEAMRRKTIDELRRKEERLRRDSDAIHRGAEEARRKAQRLMEEAERTLKNQTRPPQWRK